MYEYEKKLHGEVHELIALGTIALLCHFLGWNHAPTIMLAWAAVSLVYAMYYAWKAA